MTDPRIASAAVFDHILSRSAFTGDFPDDRPASPTWLTVPISVGFGALSRRYHRRWDRKGGWKAPVPVISVGNLTVGGTGKTPLVIALIRLIRELRPVLNAPDAIAVLSRGYGRASSDLVAVELTSDYRRTGDEPLLIKQTVPGVSVVVHRDRVLGAQCAVSRFGARLLIQDDGFQNRNLARDLDLVVVDGRNPLGNGRLLPAGPLREPPENICRASAIVGVGDDTQAAERWASDCGKPFVSAAPVLSLPPDLSTNVYILTSIARPSRFVKMLKDKGFNIVGGRAFGDHHRFRSGELLDVSRAAVACGADEVITTEKDRVRIANWPGAIPLRVAPLILQFQNAENVKILLEPVLSKLVKSVS